MNDLPPAVHLERVARRYGRNLVLADVSLTVRQGRVVVLHGPNGAGKTTLLKVLATRLRPSRGRGEVFGHDLVGAAHEVRRKSALLSVYGGSYPDLTALENLRLAARLYGQATADAELLALLASVKLAEAAHKPVRSYSSGMKKRLGIARLHLSHARLWLLDEPYAALDEAGKSYVDELLLTARAQQKTMILASHELDRVAPFADAVLQVEGGGVTLLDLESSRHTASPRQRKAAVGGGSV